MKKNILVSLLLGIGLILSQIAPGFLGGMRFDFLLIFMFISIFITQDAKTSLLVGIIGGLLSAMVSTVPMGQIPNLIEKIIVSFYVLALIKLVKGRLNTLNTIFISSSATILSGFLFLTITKFIFGLSLDLSHLFTLVVLPASVLNSIGTIFIYKLIRRISKYTSFNIQ